LLIPRLPRLFPTLVLLALAPGCSESEALVTDDPPLDAEVLVGVPGGEDDLEFVALEPGDRVQLETFFQGGTHVNLAIRCLGLGNRAFINVLAENLATGATVEARTSSANPRPLLCRDAHTCDLIPFLVMMSGITATNEELSGLLVEITAEAKGVSGEIAVGSQVVELRTDELGY
jgi:hypothetical protein